MVEYSPDDLRALVGREGATEMELFFELVWGLVVHLLAELFRMVAIVVVWTPVSLICCVAERVRDAAAKRREVESL